ncbi:MAG: alanine racemase [Actinobacteria bacterium]|nr:alanine racemase [Actinomycetota bacterium]
MTLSLEVDRTAWNRHVDGVAGRVSGLVPVVKGNGYGLGRRWLADRASRLADVLAVGTVHELADVPQGVTAVVLTPALDVTSVARADAILTVGSMAHLAALGRTPRQVLVKIRSSMNRYGMPVAEAATLIDECERAGHAVEGVSIHPPLAGSSADHANEIASLLRHIDARYTAWVSHVSVDDYDALRAAEPTRQWRLRLGTSLWHGDKSMFHLRADVLDARPVDAGAVVGYHASTVSTAGTLLMVGCGSTHGVAPLPDGRSPFHFGRQRLVLVEAPHMHTTLVLAPHGQPSPQVGEFVDVQRPLITTQPDHVDWR